MKIISYFIYKCNTFFKIFKILNFRKPDFTKIRKWQAVLLNRHVRFINS